MKSKIYQQPNSKTRLTFILSALLFTLGFNSCKKFVEAPPPATYLSNASVFSDNADAQAAMAGIYTTMQQYSYGGGRGGLSITPGLSADEIALYPGAGQPSTVTYKNALSGTNPPEGTCWNDSYNLIYQANAAINSIPSSEGMTTAIKNQFLGEALFIRAYCYFYLVNFYGDVPLVLTTNYQKNATLPRTSSATVWQQIIADLKQAQGLLGDTYVDGGGVQSSEHVRPNREAVNALLARAYLYNQNWSDAEKQASNVINSGLYTLLHDLTQVFLAGSPEAIWQLELPPNSYLNTTDGQIFLRPLAMYDGGGANAGHPFYMSNTLVQAFEPGDLRKTDWVASITVSGITYYYPYKYRTLYGPPPTEYPMMLRYAEQYLVRAEAEANGAGNGIPGAIADIDSIRKRAGLKFYSGTQDQASVLAAIMHERQVELFIENGHRWLDLKRTGLVNSVMGSPGNQCALKGGTWNSIQQLYPISQSELKADPNLTQTPGY